MTSVTLLDPPESFGKVAVLFGGVSAEREVSLSSGGAVLAGLKRLGIDAHAFDPALRPLAELASDGFDRVSIHLHGRGGEDGTVQGALELMGLPYTGPGVMASSLAMDKLRTKLLWQAAGLPVPAYALLDENSDFAAIEAELGLPLFVKPASEGSSIGVTKVKQPGALRAAFELARQYDDVVLAEQNLDGGEYTAAILNGVVLPMVKIEPATEFYDYEAKYKRDDTVYRCPADIAPELAEEIRAMVRRAFWVIGGEGWGRVDFLMDTAGKPYLLEVNTSPGMTDHSLVPMAAKAAGIGFDELCLRILAGAHCGRSGGQTKAG